MPMIARAAAALLALAVSSAAIATSWTAYGNARFGYVVDLPPGFPPIREADNSDGGVSASAEGHAALSVWGSNLLDSTFRREAESRIAGDAEKGWSIGYRAVTARAASWSGSKGDRILYVRAIAGCKDQAAFMRIEYDASAKAVYDPIVSRLARSLKASGGC
ncbi:hypothetical protein HCU64_01385 [Methylobacterium sp. C25]|nr:hypothetical protein [Methylobacterium sp. C25]